MNIKLKNKIFAVIGAGAIAIASVMLQSLEGVEYKPYYDVGGVLTVCYGHTGSDIIKDKIYTESECHALLDKDLKRFGVQVDKLVTVDIPDTTRAALYSFTYNVGIGAFKRSTLLKKLNTGDVVGACDEMKRWIYAGGKKWQGLMNRREIEDEVCHLQLKPLLP